MDHGLKKLTWGIITHMWNNIQSIKLLITQEKRKIKIPKLEFLKI